MSTKAGFERWDWSPLVKGTTKRAVAVTSADADVILSRVQVIIEEAGSDATKLTLDSATSGVTLTSGTAGAWSFTIGPITAAQTEALQPVLHTIYVKLTDSNGNVLEPIKGNWRILPK